MNNTGCFLFDWPDPVGPGLAVLFRRPQAKQPDRPGLAIQKNTATITVAINSRETPQHCNGQCTGCQ